MTTYCCRTNWGWVVTVCAFLHYVIVLGSLYNYSILFLSFQHEFQSGAAVTGWVGSMANALSCLLSPVSSLVLRHLSCRTGSALGVLLFSAGLAATSFAAELWHTFLSFGLLAAVGCNLMQVADFTRLGHWFEGGAFYRASAVITVGSSVGMMVMSLVLTALISAFEWRDCLRLVSASVLVLGCLFSLVALQDPRPIGRPSRDDGTEKGEEEVVEEKGATKETLLGPKSEAETRLSSGPDRPAVETHVVSGEEEKGKPGLDAVERGRSDWSLVLRQPNTWLYSVAVILANNAYTFANINMGSFMDDLDFSKQDIALVIFLFAGTETLGKVAVAMVTKRLQFSLMYLHVVTCLMAALVVGMMALVDRLVSIALCACAFGLVRSSLYGLAYGGPKQLFGDYGMAVVNALATIPFGIGILMSAPITGGLYDVTGNYTLSLLVIIGCFVTSSACFLLIPLWGTRGVARPPCLASKVKGRDPDCAEAV